MRAALRELHEETGIQSARIVASVRGIAAVLLWLAVAGRTSCLEHAPHSLPCNCGAPAVTGRLQIRCLLAD